MADPQSPVGQVVSSNEESKNDRSLGSYESPSDPCLLIKWKQSSGPPDLDYVPKEEVYEHLELNVLINFLVVVLLMTLFSTFLESPSTLKCLKFIFSSG
jgi:hypothetical protein